MRSTWLDSYLRRILERDGEAVSGVTSPARLRSILHLIGANQSGELVKARLAQDAGIPASSITNYLDALASVYLIDLVPAWTPNLTRREMGRPKAMVADQALALRLSKLTEAQLLPLTNTWVGSFFESFVMQELLKQQTWAESEFDIYHYRDRNGIEVDCLIELADGRVIGVEIKSSASYRAEQFKGLLALQQRVGERLHAGVVLGMAPQSFQFAERMWGLPASALWQLSS